MEGGHPLNENDDRAPYLAGSFGYAVAGLGGLLAANGGGATASLSYLGNACTKAAVEAATCARPWQIPLSAFAAGTLAVIVTAFLCWISQVLYLQKGYVAGTRARDCAIATGAMSLVAFMVGCCGAWAAMTAALPVK